jgi:hypothetical protein
MVDEWTNDGDALHEDTLASLRAIIEDESDILVEHRFYRGSRSPLRFVCGDFDELKKYVTSKTSPGDSLYFWVLERCCTTANAFVHGKVPDSRGLTPKGGAY